MAEIKYSYCKDENGELVYIKSMSNATRHARRLYCLSCGQEMVANLGDKKAWYFSHKVDCACNGESYLHKLAKRRIREKFMSEERFPIKFQRDIPCSEKGKCPFYSSFNCINDEQYVLRDLKFWKEETIYDTCEEEVTVGDFRPDLLLTNSTKPKRPPIFIEIYNTHKSSEAKTSSNYIVIETIQITSEAVIDNIIENGFIEGVNCTTHNFKLTLPSIRKKYVPIERFVLFPNGGAIVNNPINRDVLCNRVYQKIYQNSLVELNISQEKVCYPNELSFIYYNFGPIEKGLLYLKKKGWAIRNCKLCKYYTFRANNFIYGDFICTQYKILGLQHSNPKQTTAINCTRYRLKQEFLDYPLSQLEKEVYELPESETETDNNS